MLKLRRSNQLLIEQRPELAKLIFVARICNDKGDVAGKIVKRTVQLKFLIVSFTFIKSQIYLNLLL